MPAEMKNTFLLPHLMKLSGLKNWPAQVPTGAQVNEFIPEICQVPYDYLFEYDGAAMAECTLLVHEYIGVDTISANLACYNFEGEAMGAKFNYYKDHMPDFDRTHPFISGPEDLDKLRFPGLDSGRFPYLIEYAKTYEHFTGIPQLTTFSAPWTLACNLYGTENLIMDAISEPEFVHEFLRRIVEDVHAPMFRALKEIFPFDRCMLADAFASLPMTSVAILREFLLPYWELESKSIGLKPGACSDSGIWGFSKVSGAEREEMMSIVNKLGGTLYVCDPDVLELGLDFCRKYADEHKTGLSLGLSTSFLQNSTPEQIAERVRDYVLAGKAGITPFVMVFNNIAPHTPVENIHAAVDAANIYGAPEATINTPMEYSEHPSFIDFLRGKMKYNVEGYTFSWLDHSTLKL